MRDLVQAYMPELAERIDNWRRWVYVRGGLRTDCCRSIESRYRAPSALGKAGQADSRFVDCLDAAVLEKVVTRLPERERLLLKAHYVLRQAERVTCRKLGLRMGSDGEVYMGAVYRAACMIKNNLDKYSMDRYKANYNLIPSLSDEAGTLMGALACAEGAVEVKMAR